ncbi:MAG: heavy metal translocating P-type ATPase [Nitrospinota bacterium]
MSQDKDPERLSLLVSGMDCLDCAQKIEQALGEVDGVVSASLNFATARLEVRLEPEGPDPEMLKARVRALGYGVMEPGGEAATTSRGTFEGGFFQRKRFFLTICSGLLTGLGLLLGLLGYREILTIPLFAAAMVTGGYYIGPKALGAARRLSADMNLLMSIAVIGAALIGEWLEGATVVFLFSLAQLLESATMNKARRAIKSLMDLSPAEALVRRDGQELKLPAEEVMEGELILIRPGEKVPLDGRIVHGRSSLNQAPITGESMLLEKGEGEPVVAGTINGEGALEVEVTHRAKDTTLARIISLVEEAQAQKAPTQHFVDRFAACYTPAVIGGAVALALVPSLFLGLPFADWFYRALVLLVIACPCALVLSTPVSIVSGLTRAARTGILIKGGAHLETMAALKVVCFDKTGTLTEGVPRVTDVIPVGGFSPEKLLTVAAAAESRSEHPIAKAIMERAQKENLALPEVRSFQALPGMGARALLDGEPVLIGSHRLFEKEGLCDHSVDPRLLSLEEEGKTVVMIGGGRELLGVLGVADGVRKEAAPALSALRRQGIPRLVMLTGDNEGTARAIAREVGVDEYRAELLPQDKVEAVREELSRHGKVAMVGDGVNDAPALVAASVGVAMGTAGTDAALEIADIALMADDLEKLPLALGISRKTLRVIKENITFSLLVKALFLALALPGLATLWMAIAADMGVSLLVIANGLRLLRLKLSR